MERKLVRAAGLVAVALGAAGCAAPRILGTATLVDEKGAPIPGPAVGVTVNFINLGANIDESIASVQTDAKGKYTSAELPPGKYSVEAMLPGFVIERQTVELKKHGKKKAPFLLKRIREAKGKSVKESLEENIPTPGQVQIEPPY
jgi:hypothetical protein